MSASLETRRRRGARLLACVACLVLPLSALGAGPLERDHPRVQQGREAYLAGRYEDALKAFEDAKKERPNDPAVDFNRGDALAKLGRVKDAQEVFRGVTESNRPDLRQKAWYNLGNLAATTGDRVEALKSYRRALTLDPQDVQARHNYEVVLRNLPPPQDNSADGGSDGGGDSGTDGGRPDGGEDGGTKADGGTPVDGGTDGGQDGGADGGADGGGDGGADGGGDGGADGGGDGGADGGDGGQEGPPQKGDGGSDGGSDGGQDEGEGDPKDGGTDGGSESEGDAEDSRSDGGVSPSELDRQEAERLLDAMKQNEKNLQLWRFQQKKKQRKANEKDW
ncbi:MULTISPECIES: tetratricopeptide repeat protein [unclassified Myxococcus]|uniref:tetratricopeptide repeat protein n=1 Tax=unclassified Myxococcus TaxID=2648731 RepID=UPI00157ADF74|nr:MULTISPECIES: tetratricopeptide repeat protein [unclassified Myxococcus]NTX00714.1 tetratricopeptide repeat protein [Myxococcus sp. CA040A]NTX33600.1 tetratricopeptide repeat protein [Myxococcus sp. CA033]